MLNDYVITCKGKRVTVFDYSLNDSFHADSSDSIVENIIEAMNAMTGARIWEKQIGEPGVKHLKLFRELKFR